MVVVAWLVFVTIVKLLHHHLQHIAAEDDAAARRLATVAADFYVYHPWYSVLSNYMQEVGLLWHVLVQIQFHRRSIASSSEETGSNNWMVATNER